jgi:ABC-2 type transport system ATP-binding protein
MFWALGTSCLFGGDELIQVNNLLKKYDGFTAANNVNLTVHPGEVTILLGPNGAGKSTTIKSIAGLLTYKGTITINGYDNKSIEAKRIFGFVPEVPALYELLTIQEHTEFIARAYRLADGWQERTDELLKRFEVFDKKDKLARELSKGMMQKISIILALMIEPKAVLFDEPLVGLDPKAINEMLTVFSGLRDAGAGILISTHIIDTINTIWDRVYIMVKGEIIYEATKDELKGRELKEIFFEMTEGRE